MTQPALPFTRTTERQAREHYRLTARRHSLGLVSGDVLKLAYEAWKRTRSRNWPGKF